MDILTQDGTKTITAQQFIDLHSDLVIPVPINYAEFGWFVVAPQGQPTYDPIMQTVRELPPIHDGSHWLQQWEIVQLDPETVNANQERKKAETNARLLAEILDLQTLALRALVEDTDTVWLDKRRAAIAALRGQIVK